MQAKPWYQSKTIWTSLVGFVVAVAVAVGYVDNETGLKLAGLILPVLFMFLRISDVPIGSGPVEPKALDLTPD
jgi:hypothetical protein